MARRQDAAGCGGPRAQRLTRLTVRVHDFAQARSTLRVAADLRLRVQLASGEDATAVLGQGALAALRRELGTRLFVDCGPREGDVMAGVRAGLDDLVFCGSETSFARLARIAARGGARLHRRLDPPVVTLAFGENPGRRLASAFCPPSWALERRQSRDAACD